MLTPRGSFFVCTQLRAHWANEIIRVERANFAPFVEQAAMTYLHCSVLFIIAENDEMENCQKEVQQAAFERAKDAREPKTFGEVRACSPAARRSASSHLVRIAPRGTHGVAPAHP